MSQNNTNRDIRRFETDADGNTTRVLLNTDEPLGLLDGDYQEQLEELENRLNAITGGAYSNTVQIGHGGTGAESAKAAMTNLTTELDSILSSDEFVYSFLAKRVGGPSAGNVYKIPQNIVAAQIGALKATNNLSDLQNALTGLQNLYHDVPIANPGSVPLKIWFDDTYVMLGRYIFTSENGYRVDPKYYTLGSLVDDYLSEYFTKKSNNLSDLQSKPSAVSNLFDGLSSAGIPTIDRTVELMANKSSFPSGTGKITLEDLFDDYLLSAFNTEYGMSKNAGLGRYEFTGIAASAMKAEQAYSIINGSPISSLGHRYFNCRRKTFSGLNPGDNTVTFDPLVTSSTILNYNILSVSCISVDSGRSVTVKSFSVECENRPSDSRNEYTVTADIYVNGTGISFDLEVLYSYEVSV